MCGRFSQHFEPGEIVSLFGVAPGDSFVRNYNVAPTDSPIVIVRGEDGDRRIVHMSWGLPLQRLKKILPLARAESVSSKPSFKQSVEKRRCIVPVAGFYEWQDIGKKKRQPHYASTEGVMGLAAIHKSGHFAILTTPSNTEMVHIHDRMPAVLPPDQFDAWLDPETEVPFLEGLLVPYEGAMHAHSVSHHVNKAEHNDPECIAPFTQKEPPQGELPF